ncbi:MULTISPECIES: carbon-nitrogen hydrolase family protein [unclassified Moraxella]|uniref:carbon-nitrogen hydrolase family protein n=1 Tax=unclassified Moraxella TaxID=2685852 RepID=UPI003AF98002
MKIAVAQTQPIKGDIKANLAEHIKFIQQALEHDINILVFPELSLTGYEPTLAKFLAMTAQQIDVELAEIQSLANTHHMTIAVGLPTKTDDNSDKIFISLAIFQPNQSPIIYSKQILYHTEQAVFTAGQQGIVLPIDDKKIALAICYELSQDAHNQQAKTNQADVYIASVCNSVAGVDNDLNHLSHVAKTQKMLTLMANYIGESGGYQCAGKSSIWNVNGELVAQLAYKQGILAFDTTTNDRFSILVN